MKKLSLDLDALVVESFVAGGGDGAGTVEGRDSTTDCTVTESGNAFCLESAETACGPCASDAKFCTHGGSCVGATCKDHTCGGYTCGCEGPTSPMFCL